MKKERVGQRTSGRHHDALARASEHCVLQPLKICDFLCFRDVAMALSAASKKGTNWVMAVITPGKVISGGTPNVSCGFFTIWEAGVSLNVEMYSIKGRGRTWL